MGLVPEEIDLRGLAVAEETTIGLLDALVTQWDFCASSRFLEGFKMFRGDVICVEPLKKLFLRGDFKGCDCPFELFKDKVYSFWGGEAPFPGEEVLVILLDLFRIWLDVECVLQELEEAFMEVVGEPLVIRLMRQGRVPLGSLLRPLEERLDVLG